MLERQRQARPLRGLSLLGPAFVAAIAYVDPGNVASNVSAGAKYGFLLVWVIVTANVMAGLVQYLSAKLGLVTGQSLPEAIGDRMARPTRLTFWLQAELVAMATDLAEVVGGAIALHLLFGLPLLLGGVITGMVSMALLTVQDRRGQRSFEYVISALLAIIAIGFLASVVVEPPPLPEAAAGLIPHFQGTESLLLATAMLGATVMPHAVYLHSGLTRDRHGRPAEGEPRRRLLRITRWDVCLAMVFAGAVNMAMLLAAATNLRGRDGVDTIEGAHAAVRDSLGPTVALLFAIGLLASGPRIVIGRRLCRCDDHARTTAPIHPHRRATADHPAARARDSRRGHRPHPRTGDIAGGVVLRHPLRPHTADPIDRRPPADGQRRQSSGYHAAGLDYCRANFGAQRCPDFPYPCELVSSGSRL